MTTMLARTLGEETATKMAADPVLFVRAFDRDPWPYQADILRQVVERDAAGRFVSRLAVVSMPRQNGKTTLSAWLALWRLYCDPGGQEIISVANDRAQAGIILNDARRIIRNSGVLYSLLSDWGLTRNEIRLGDGNRWLIKSSEHVSSRGLRPSHISYDELGWATDRDLFDALAAGQAAQANPLIVITSTVGPVQAGILWELFELARASDPAIRLIYHSDNPSPLITDEYLERQRTLLPAHVFAREHQNTWGEGSDAFCTLADWERAIDGGDPRRDTDSGPCSAFLDLGWVHDETALAVGKKAATGKTAVVALEGWRGSQARPVDFSSVERRLIELAGRLNINRLQIESPQGVGMAQRLNLEGLTSDVLHPTAKSNQEHWGALYTALKAGTVQLPNDPKLRQQLLTLTIQTTATGWRVVDVPSIHQDRARAVAGVVALLQEANCPTWEDLKDLGHIEFESPFKWDSNWLRSASFDRWG